MKKRLLTQIASALKILKTKEGYADSTLKRSATLILNNKAKASAEAVRLANKFRTSLNNTASKAKSISNSNKNANIQNRRLVPHSKFDLAEGKIQHDKLSVFKSLNRFRQRLVIFDIVMGAFRNTWWAKPLLVTYIIISYLFSAVLLARLAFLIEIFQLDFWGLVDYFKNLDLDSVEGLFQDWNPVPKEPMAPTLGMPRIPVEDNPFAGTYIQQVDPKEFAVEQFNRAKLLADKAYINAAKAVRYLPEVMNTSSYNSALQGLNAAYEQAINYYGSASDFRKALGLYSGIKGWFNGWIGYPLYDAATWLCTINPFILLGALSGLLLLNPVGLFQIVMYFPLKLLSFPVELADWFMIHYMDTYIVALNNKVQHIFMKTGIAELFKGLSGREMEGDNLDEAIRFHNTQMAGYKTNPSELNTDRLGQGIVRTSVAEYLKEFGELPELPVDKGKGPEGGGGTSLTQFLKDWVASDNSQAVEPAPSVNVQSPEGTKTPINLENNTTSSGAAESSSAGNNQVPNARTISRSGSGSTTPRGGAVGISVVLETEATDEILAEATKKLADAAVPAETPSVPKVKLSADHLDKIPNPYSKPSSFRTR